MMTDEELENIVMQTTADIYNALSPAYVAYIEGKYLASGKVLEYVAEEVYYLLSVSAISRNNAKINNIVTKRRANIIQELNNEE